MNTTNDTTGAGPFFVMIDDDQTAGEFETIEQARSEGAKLSAAERLPCTFSIQDASGNHLEDIPRRPLEDQIKAFALHRDALA